MNNQQLLKRLTEANGASGYETNVARIIGEAFAPYCDDVRIDKLGNLTAIKKAVRGDNPPRIMLAAHMDEIGLMVTKIEDNGFLRFTNVGGVDPRTLLAQEVIVHGREDLTGIIGAKPPHLTDEEDRKKAVDIDKLFIDLAGSREEVEKYIAVGDMVTLKRNFLMLHKDTAAAKAMDDRAGVVVLFQTLKELQYLNSGADLYAVATTQEEVGVRGAATSSYSIEPDIGIAIDVCHATMPGVDEEDAAEMGKGPAIGFGPHVHRKIFKKLKDVAQETGLDYQIEAAPYPGGTDAFAIQIARTGVASGLVSIPLRYMHTSVEMVSMKDIKRTGQLLARFIARIDRDFVEGLTCY